LQHLRTERPALFTCLRHADVEATNWQAEQAIRPAVVTRKVCGGNRTPRGADTQQMVASVLRTCWQQQRDPLELLIALQRSRRPDHVELDTEREVYHVAPRDEGRDLGRTDRLDELVVAEERPEARPPRGGERELVVDQ